MRNPLLLLVACAVAAAPLALAGSDGVPTTSMTTPDLQMIVVGPVAGQYMAYDHCTPNCIFSIWLYIEANDIPGLQRGDVVHDDTCGGLIESDSIWS